MYLFNLKIFGIHLNKKKIFLQIFACIKSKIKNTNIL